MAWIRTAISLITFGFSVYKFFQIQSEKAGQPERLIVPREFALIMISVGLLSLIMATLQFRRDRTALIKMDPEVPRSLAGLLAALIALLGIVALIAVIFRQ